MSEIPEDILKLAHDLALELAKPEAEASCENPIARALLAERMAERERCAKAIAELRRLLHSQFEAVEISREDAVYRICESAIRNQEKP